VRHNHDTLKAGRVSSVSIYIPFHKEGMKITYAGRTGCLNAIDPHSGHLKLRLHAVKDNPKIDGIILFKGSISGKKIRLNFFF